jgi:predicted ATPase
VSMTRTIDRVERIAKAIDAHPLSPSKMIERSNERLWEAENYRMQGEVARDEGDLSAALTAFSRAITVARRQSARSLELRAALAWAKVAAAQGRRAEARELLAPVCGWFTERFDTTDLKEAKALLDELT